VEVFEPAGEVELAGGEVAGGDEVEDGVLELGGKLGEGVAGAGASDGVELVEAELIVESEGWGRGRQKGFAGAGGESGVNVGGETFCLGPEDEGGDGLEGGELGGAEVLRDVDGSVVDKVLEAKAGRWLGDHAGAKEVLILSTDGHDTTLLEAAAYVRVLIGRRNEEEKSRLRFRGSPPKVVCRFWWCCGACE
jgi:hypothetical protein